MKKLLIILLGLVASCTKPSISEQAIPVTNYSIIGKWQNGSNLTLSINWLEIDSFNIVNKILNKGNEDTIIIKSSYVRINSDSIRLLTIRELKDTVIYATQNVYCKNKNDSVLYFGSRDGIYKKVK